MYGVQFLTGLEISLCATTTSRSVCPTSYPMGEAAGAWSWLHTTV